MVRLATDTFSRKLKKLKRRNNSLLCRYFTLLYDKQYASDLVGENCNGNSDPVKS
jgi:hypothetical protein